MLFGQRVMSFLNQVNRVVWAIVIRGIAKDPEDYSWVRVIYCNQDFISRTICHFLQCVVNPRWCYPADSNYSVMAPIVHKSHIHLIVSPITGRLSGCREACRYFAPPPPPPPPGGGGGGGGGTPRPPPPPPPPYWGWWKGGMGKPRLSEKLNWFEPKR